MGEEKATLEKTEENIKVLSNLMGCLSKRSDVSPLLNSNFIRILELFQKHCNWYAFCA